MFAFLYTEFEKIVRQARNGIHGKYVCRFHKKQIMTQQLFIESFKTIYYWNVSYVCNHDVLYGVYLNYLLC